MYHGQVAHQPPRCTSSVCSWVVRLTHRAMRQEAIIWVPGGSPVYPKFRHGRVGSTRAGEAAGPVFPSGPRRSAPPGADTGGAWGLAAGWGWFAVVSAPPIRLGEGRQSGHDHVLRIVVDGCVYRGYRLR